MVRIGLERAHHIYLLLGWTICLKLRVVHEWLLNFVVGAEVTMTSVIQQPCCIGPNRELAFASSTTGYNSNTTMQDGYSSEEELKEINSSKRQKKQQKAKSSKPRTYSATAVTPSRYSKREKINLELVVSMIWYFRSCLYSSASSGGGVTGGSRSSSRAVLGCTINNSVYPHQAGGAEKRKRADTITATDSCQYYFGSCDSSSDLSSAPKPSAQSSSLMIRRCRSSLSAPSYNLSFR